MSNQQERPFLTWTKDENTMKKAADFIAEYEGLRLNSYRCAAGVLTIGYGHTAGVKEGDSITLEKAVSFLDADIRSVARYLARFVNHEVTEGQFVALISLGFNLGAQKMVRTCPKLMMALNTGDISAAAREFLDCDKAGGKRLPGLTRRRKAESELFLSDFSGAEP